MTGFLLIVAGALVTVAAGLTLARQRYLVVTVRGRSMEPTLRDGERVLVRRRPVSRIPRDEIIVMASASAAPSEPGDGRYRIKRIVARPRDPVPTALANDLGLPQGATVPENGILVLGDNSQHSHDSRQGGFYSRDQVIGVVLRKIA
jgi:signal peptidase I